MQRLVQAVKTCHESIQIWKTGNLPMGRTLELMKMLSRHEFITSSPRKDDRFLNGVMMAKCHTIPERGLQNTTVAEVLMTKGQDKVGSWLWCHTDDTVYDAVKQMAQNNIGSLVVLKPGQQQMIAGILTERDYLRKVIVQDRSSKYTKVKEIMTDRDKLITVTSDTNILTAMQVMTENQIRHVPVVDGKIVGMISIVDVVRAVLDQQHGEVKRLNEFIHGDYF